MRIALRTLALSAAALCATAAFAANQARVDVPFSFTAKGQSYPAGSYKVALDANQNVVTLESQNEPAKQITWTVGPTEPANYPAVLKFDLKGADHALSTIQCGTKITADLDRNAKHGVSATTSIGGQ